MCANERSTTKSKVCKQKLLAKRAVFLLVRQIDVIVDWLVNGDEEIVYFKSAIQDVVFLHLDLLCNADNYGGAAGFVYGERGIELF